MPLLLLPTLHCGMGVSAILDMTPALSSLVVLQLLNILLLVKLSVMLANWAVTFGYLLLLLRLELSRIST